MKRYLSLLGAAFVLTLTALNAAAAPFTERNERTGWITVTTEYYQCTVFPGSMFPVWFNSPDGTHRFPRHFMLDWIKVEKESDLTLHYLRHDCYAEVKILEEDADHLVFECTGRFCLDTHHFPNVTARYRYTIKRNSPELQLDAELVSDDPAKAKEYLLNCGVLAWEGKPFTDIQLAGGEIQPFRPDTESLGGDGKSFSSDAGMDLLERGLRIGIAGASVAWNNAKGRYFTYLSHAQKVEERRWNGQAPYRFSVKFRIDGRNGQ